MSVKYTKDDIIKFRNDICEKCHCHASCLDTFEDMNEHIQYCPKFFNYMIGYTSFVVEQCEWERNHPEEVEARHKKNLEIAKNIKSQNLKSKRLKKS